METVELEQMNQKEISELSNEELLKVAKSSKPSPLVDAFFIGFLIGIVVYGILANSWGFTLLIPLFLIYRFLKKPKQQEILREELIKRNLQ